MYQSILIKNVLELFWLMPSKVIKFKNMELTVQLSGYNVQQLMILHHRTPQIPISTSSVSIMRDH